MRRNDIDFSGLLYLGVGVVLFAAGCTPSEKAPLSGRLNLQYSSSTDAGLIFVLEDGSSEAIAFRGYGTLAGGVTPDVYSMLCSSEATGVATAVGAGLKDGGARPDRIMAAPGERIRILIPREYFQRYKGQSCRLRLTLDSNSEITSQEFVP